jgi:hypothetical protein
MMFNTSILMDIVFILMPQREIFGFPRPQAPGSRLTILHPRRRAIVIIRESG